MNRRQFLAATGLALAVPTLIPASALGREDKAAPSERVTLGVVGWGMQGPGNTEAFLGLKDCQVVAACDLDKKHLQSALDKINGKNGNKDCKAYHDYREMMARPEIDAVMLAVPDTWHAMVATEAARNKKDIYGEKPLARTIAEQQAIVKAVRQNHRIWQTGSWQRSQSPFRKAAEIVRNGLIGKITRVEVGLPDGHTDFAGTGGPLAAKLKPGAHADFLAKVVPGMPEWDAAVTQPPADLDYETWTGPSKMEPYIGARVHMNWRWNYNVGGGQLLDWIGHHCDIAHWGLDMDDKGGPSEIESEGEFPPANAIWNTCTKYRITLKYPNDITMIIAGGHGDIRGGAKWIGTDGWVWVDRGGFDASNIDWFQKLPDSCTVKLYRSDNHQGNFISCVKSRKPTITPAETAHHSAIPGHLGLISLLTGHDENGKRIGRKIRWDAKKEVIIGDPEASKLLSRQYRAPLKLA
ncbi:MAG: Gfo/Idh/MocA family protein [Limisphaerales bacterium]